MTHWIGAQGQLQENTPQPNQIKFFIETRRLAESVDGLNSFIAQPAGVSRLSCVYDLLLTVRTFSR